MARKKQRKSSSPTEAQVKTFEMLLPMVEAAHKEIGDLSKKKPDGILNELKVRNINRLLLPVKELLDDEPSVEFLEVLDEESLPQNSDAVFLIGQFLAAMRQFEQLHHGYDPLEGEHRWFTEEHPRTTWDDEDL